MPRIFEATEAWKSAFPDALADVLVIQDVPNPASQADEVILTFTHPWIFEKSYPGRLKRSFQKREKSLDSQT